MVEILYDMNNILSLGTLGTKAVAFDPSLVIASSNENGFRVAKFNYFARIQDGTVGEGPFLYGIAINVATAAQIEAILEAVPTKKTGDDARISDSAFVKPLGIIREIGSYGGGTGDQTDGDGAWKSSGPINWSCPEGEGLDWWVYSLDAATLTTGANFIFCAEYMGVWLRD